MPDKPKTIKEYLDTLTPERKKAVNALRRTIKANMGKGIKEGVQYGMVGYFLPHSLYPEGYHCDPKQPLPFASIASQKNHIGIYLFCAYAQPEENARFQKEWKAAGKRLDMGKGCVRAKSLEDIPLEVVGRAIKRMTVKKFVKAYEESLPASVKAKREKAAKKKPAAKKAAARKKPAAKKATTKKKASRKKAAKK